MKLADFQDWESWAERRVGATPIIRTNMKKVLLVISIFYIVMTIIAFRLCLERSQLIGDNLLLKEQIIELKHELNRSTEAFNRQAEALRKWNVFGNSYDRRP